MDGEAVGRGTGSSNAGTSGSVGALAGNRQGHPARTQFRLFQIALGPANPIATVSKRLSASVACFGRIDALLSSSGLRSLRTSLRSQNDSCDICCVVRPFWLTLWPAPLCLNSISTEIWAPSTHATADFTGRNVRSNFFTPRHRRRSSSPSHLLSAPRTG